MAPEALTVGDDAAAVRRHVRDLVAQLGKDTDVVVAGDALGDDLPPRARRIDGLRGLVKDPAVRTRIVVCPGPDAPG
jgi:hypothetical protein